MKRTISAFILAASVMLSCTFAFAQSSDQTAKSVKYKDISGHWSEAAVEQLSEKNALPFSGEKFIPGKAVTRSEFVVMLHDALDISIEYLKQPDIKDYFNDVKQDASYTSDLIDLVTANIWDGKGSFKPESTLPREEMVHYIMNAYKYEMGDRYALINIKPPFFKDDDQVTPIYSGEVGRAAHYKLIEGSGNVFHPKANTTRAEAAVVISKLVNLLEKTNPAILIHSEAAAKDDSLEMKLIIANNSKKPVTFTHSSGKKYDFVLLDSANKELYRWSKDKAFTMMVTSTSIAAGKSVEFSETLNGNDYKAIKDKAVVLKAYLIGSSDSFTINPDGYEFKLK